MNIDYEKISLAAREEASNLLVSVRQVKKIIEAYEAQKNPPEWVPLDLATVKQGQEVRYAHWSSDVPPVFFVCAYKGSFITDNAFITDNGVENFILRGKSDWLMRAPKPKTVHVRVFKHETEEAYVALTEPLLTPGVSWELVGEGDIEVTL